MSHLRISAWVVSFIYVYWMWNWAPLHLYPPDPTAKVMILDDICKEKLDFNI